MRSGGRLFELGSDRLVGQQGCLRAVPGAPIGIDIAVGHLRECPVHFLPLVSRGRAVGGRPHQGMAEPDLGTKLDQSRRLGRVRGICAEPEHSGRPPQQGCVAEGFGRRGNEQAPGLVRERR